MYHSERVYLDELAKLLKEADQEKLMLTVAEYAFLCECNGKADEIRVAKGLCEHPKSVKELNRRMLAGSILLKDTLMKAVNGEI